MATDKDNNQDSNWPLPKFIFEVDFGTTVPKVLFTEISGLDVEAQLIEYRGGNSKQFSTVKMPGIAKFSNITLKKGVFKSDAAFHDWQRQAVSNTAGKTTVTIRLLDEAGKPVIVWILLNARPVKITGTDLKADANEVAVESIELVHEGLQVSNS